MKIIVAYDIIKNEVRNQIIEVLLGFGLIRIQNSIFLGEISEKKIEQLVKIIEKLIDKKEDSIYFFKICEKDYLKINYFGKNIEINYFNKNFFIF